MVVQEALKEPVAFSKFPTLWTLSAAHVPILLSILSICRFCRLRQSDVVDIFVLLVIVSPEGREREPE